jgi:hypothetical protein
MLKNCNKIHNFIMFSEIIVFLVEINNSNTPYTVNIVNSANSNNK